MSVGWISPNTLEKQTACLQASLSNLAYLKFKSEYNLSNRWLNLRCFSFSAGVDKTKDKKSQTWQGEDYYFTGRQSNGF